VYIFGNTCWAAKRVGQQLAAFYALAYVFQLLQQRFVALPLDQEIERGQDRQSRLDQRQKLLVEDQERGLLQLAERRPNWPPPVESMVRGLTQ
jgi:hypothetical protein